MEYTSEQGSQSPLSRGAALKYMCVEGTGGEQTWKSN